MTLIKITKEQLEFLETGTMIYGPNGLKYYHMPIWFKETPEEGIYETYSFDKLPEEFKEGIENIRHVVKKRDIDGP